jgi:hypothetical protein
MYLIVIEALSDLGGAMPPPIYYYQPYRLAETLDEAAELMRDYLRLDPDQGALIPKYFAVYKEKDGEFGAPEYFEPTPELTVADATEWLADTGRI